MSKKAIHDQISSTRLLIENAMQHPDIQQRLQETGYTAEHLRKGKVLLEEAIRLQQQQKDSYGMQYNATDQLRAEFQALRERYEQHRKIALLVFHQNRGMQNSLGINRPLPKTQAGWTDQLLRFYTKALELNRELSALGLRQSELQQTLAMAEAYGQAQQQQQDRKGRAQLATQQRNEALRQLRQWEKGFRAVVKVALSEEPRLLEVLGISVAV